MKPCWILVANAAHARLFRQDGPRSKLVPLATLAHPESRLQGRELADDRPGHEATDHSPGGNRFEPRGDVRRKEHQRFAREIAKRLDAGLASHEFDALWVFASSPFLGELNAQFSAALQPHLQRVQDTDLSALSLREIEQRLRDLRAERA